jgi:hypothetical protein
MCVLYALLGGYCPCLIHTSRRKKLRHHYSLDEEPKDFLATCLCTSCCANCQEAQELAKRGQLIRLDFSTHESTVFITLGVPNGGRMGGPVSNQPR